MEPQLILSTEKKLVGIKQTMSLADNQTGKLWARFMPRRKEVPNIISNDLYSLQRYPPSYFERFAPHTLFDKWAAVEVNDVSSIPQEMETITIPHGLYAVFHYKGLSTDNTVFQYIYTSWLPASGYVLANRPHFEVLGEKYKNGSPDSEEEIWIPVEHAPNI